jgi:NAD dependent epimerase/dehydratase family enzyme
MRHEAVHGPVNLVTPHPLSNKEFTKILSRVLHRPAVFPAPAFGVKLLLGEMGESLLLSGARVLPKRLLESGYVFQLSELEAALINIFSKISLRRWEKSVVE